MTVYKNKENHSLKWLVAIVVFIIGMTFTWSSVEGAELSSSLNIHKAHSEADSFCKSRFRPKWFPGFVKPPKTILASVTPNSTDKKEAAESVLPVDGTQPKIQSVQKDDYIRQS